MRKIFLLALVVLIAQGACALSLERHEINVVVGNDGYATFTEKYLLKFANPFEFEEFKSEARENGSSLLAWSAAYDFFYPHFGECTGINKVSKSSISFDESARTLTLRYELAEPFARIVTDEARSSLWEIPDMAFRAFQQGSLIVVPASRIITLTLPASAEVIPEGLSPDITTAGNVIVASAMSTNTMSLRYTLPKRIVPSIGLFEVFQGLLSGSGMLWVVAAAIAAAVLFVYRHRIGQRIEDYIIEHSEIEGRAPEEEEFVLEE